MESNVPQASETPPRARAPQVLEFEAPGVVLLALEADGTFQQFRVRNLRGDWVWVTPHDPLFSAIFALAEMLKEQEGRP